MPTPTSMPASASRRTASRRLRGGARCPAPSFARPARRAGGRSRRRPRPAPRPPGYVAVADDERPAGDDRERRPGPGELDEARAGQPEASFGRLVRVRRRADRHALALPRRPRELLAQHLSDVHLHADRAPVTVVGRAVGPLLEVADVTKGATMGAAHVRVERPLERHPADGVQSRPARLEPVLGAHPPRIEHMFVSPQGRQLEELGHPAQCMSEVAGHASRSVDSGLAHSGSGAGASTARWPAIAAANWASDAKSMRGIVALRRGR